jgi:hypothetical protein
MHGLVCIEIRVFGILTECETKNETMVPEKIFGDTGAVPKIEPMPRTKLHLLELHRKRQHAPAPDPEKNKDDYKVDKDQSPDEL